MSDIFSKRAKSLLEKPISFLTAQVPEMKSYEHGALKLLVHVEVDEQNVKKMSFFGTPPKEFQVLIEAMARLMVGKSLTLVSSMTIRECEAYLRDRNSVPALKNLSPEEEADLLHFFSWLRFYQPKEKVQNYQFSSEKGPFRRLKLVEKIKEIKAFLNSPPVLDLYREHHPPELIDVDDLTVYVDAPYETSREKEIFSDLHILGVEAFQEENLNFIPED